MGKNDKDKEKDKKKKQDKNFEKEELVEVVYVVENDSVWVREVVLGINSDIHFEILSGLEKDDIIVTGPFRQLSRELHSGDRVKYDPPENDDEHSSDTEKDAEKKK